MFNPPYFSFFIETCSFVLHPKLFEIPIFLLYFTLVENSVLDYNLILKGCGIDSLPIQDVLSNIVNLEEFYTSTELVNIYNHILLTVKDSQILIQVIKCSDNYKNELTLKILLEMMQYIPDKDDDDSINLRRTCVKAIANYKDYSTVKTLLDSMNNKKEHYRVRLACADALGRIGDRFAVKPLIDLVEDDDEKSVYLKESATFALGILGDTSAIEPLIKILESKRGFLDKFSFLKEKIVEALGKLNLNNKVVMKALKNSLLDSSPMVRINAIEAIMNSDDEESINLIRPCLKDEDDEVQKNALIALYNLCGRDVLDEVISLPSYSKFLKEEAKILLEEYEEDDE